MNSAHLHIAINHSPVYAVLFGLLLLIVGRMRRSKDITSAALVLFVLAVVFAVPTYFSGRGASRAIRGVPDFDNDIRNAHLAASKLAMYATWLLAIAAFWALQQYRRLGDIPSNLRSIVWVLAFAASGLMFWTSLKGGEVRHTEARPGYVTPTPEPDTGGPGGPGGPGGAPPASGPTAPAP